MENCYVEDDQLICFCGKCKPEDYELLRDFPMPKDYQEETKIALCILPAEQIDNEEEVRRVSRIIAEYGDFRELQGEKKVEEELRKIAEMETNSQWQGIETLLQSLEESINIEVK